jgi:hypothetical protein
MAHLSAQVQSPVITPSTLHPQITVPSAINTLAQTLCIERYAKAFLRVSFATFIIFFISFSGID